ncbi:efflux RND transporter permease subunit [Rhodovibrio salinarum]|uniref:RND transporter n=1 Tax=Rhodovibrio salinarum TaxID=1087 RepID=A0A934QFC5_9PROT|nr:MMPL family transporter [Rhodovibrio salinarum]MBK1695793.1 RND transporter [Rhodovibrio salinarum]
MRKLSEHAATHRRGYFWSVLALTFALMLLAVAGTLFPRAPLLQALTIDTDPENMLADDAPVRVDHHRLKQIFGLDEFVVVGVINDSHAEGVFNPQDLANIAQLTATAKSLKFDITVDGKPVTARVVAEDIIAPGEVDNIETSGIGAVDFSYLMPRVPKTAAEAVQVRTRAQNIPMYRGTLVSADGKALALYFPITHKQISHAVEQELRHEIDSFADTGAEYHITGLPVAEDRFGAEMFFQMAVSAPLAMLCVFLLLLYFFRNVKLVLFSLVTAMIAVAFTMSLLVVCGFTVHIMSSMIPIFIIPIAILDDIHILSDFHDRYTPDRPRLEIIQEVMGELWRPMLFTSLTTIAGFASLVLTPNPPVQVFGAFVAIGVLAAWFVTVTLRPAYLMVVSDATLAKFGTAQKAKGADTERPGGALAGGLRVLGGFAAGNGKLILAGSAVVLALSVWGITKIEVNDNPIRWFESDHEIRVADRVINDHFAGSYMAYLALQPATPGSAGDQPFKQPEMLRWIAGLQGHLEAEVPTVGKVTALPDIIKTVHRELLGSPEAFRIPDSPQAVAQTILTYENSHDPDTVWNFTTTDYDRANLWLQLNSGDNKDMQSVVQAVDAYLADTPPPVAMDKTWFGLTYINLVWQERMVTGMAEALLGSFAVVLVLVIVLFRSPSWGLLAMVPLTVTVVTIYGIVGWIGKDYDMPTAVLSSLSLGLAVDYAIHFLARSRQIFARTQSWARTLPEIFEEPARAITRNIIVLGVGFLPLLASSLVPYKTVGTLISAILVLAGLATLLILPALVSLFPHHLFKKETRDASRSRSPAGGAAAGAGRR